MQSFFPFLCQLINQENAAAENYFTVSFATNVQSEPFFSDGIKEKEYKSDRIE